MTSVWGHRHKSSETDVALGHGQIQGQWCHNLQTVITVITLMLNSCAQTQFPWPNIVRLETLAKSKPWLNLAFPPNSVWTQLLMVGGKKIVIRTSVKFILLCWPLVASVMPNSLWPYGLQPARLLCPQDSLGRSTRVDCHALLQGIFPTQRSNPGLPHSRHILYCLNHQGSPN